VTREAFAAADVWITPPDGDLRASFSTSNVLLARPFGSLIAENISFS
jgi:hypothetical protein